MDLICETGPFSIITSGVTAESFSESMQAIKILSNPKSQRKLAFGLFTGVGLSEHFLF